MDSRTSQTAPGTAPSGKAAVRCRGVVKIYGGGSGRVVALRGVDLQVEQGELLMLVGPSGSGKTTLISVIAGILDQDEGDCRVFDQDLRKMPSREKTRYRGKTIGFVFQSFNLIPTLTAVENVAVPLLLNGWKRSRAIQRAGEVLDRVRLADRSRSLPAELSGGEQQRVAIARSLVHEPRLIVCDEPTSSLDQDTGQRVIELLREVAVREDRALIIVTHDSRIFKFSDRMARMNDGRVVEVIDLRKTA